MVNKIITVEERRNQIHCELKQMNMLSHSSFGAMGGSCLSITQIDQLNKRSIELNQELKILKKS